jgi:hypothetical protein
MPSSRRRPQSTMIGKRNIKMQNRSFTNIDSAPKITTNNKVTYTVKQK